MCKGTSWYITSFWWPRRNPLHSWGVLHRQGGGMWGRGFSSTPKHELCSWAIQTCNSVSFINALHRQSEFSQHFLTPLSGTHEEKANVRERKRRRRKREAEWRSKGFWYHKWFKSDSREWCSTRVHSIHLTLMLHLKDLRMIHGVELISNERFYKNHTAARA